MEKGARAVTELDLFYFILFLSIFPPVGKALLELFSEHGAHSHG